MSEEVVGTSSPLQPIPVYNKQNIVVNTLYRTGTNYFFRLLHISSAENYSNYNFESLHSPIFASVTPENSVQFFIKRDPFDSLTSMIYARVHNLSSKELEESLKNDMHHYTDQWILHLNNVKKNPNIEVINFTDLAEKPKQLISKIREKFGFEMYANDKVLEIVKDQLDTWKNPGGDGFNHMPVEKNKNNNIIKNYLSSTYMYSKQKEIYALYNSIDATIVL